MSAQKLTISALMRLVEQLTTDDKAEFISKLLRDTDSLWKVVDTMSGGVFGIYTANDEEDVCKQFLANFDFSKWFGDGVSSDEDGDNNGECTFCDIKDDHSHKYAHLPTNKILKHFLERGFMFITREIIMRTKS